MCNDVAEHIQVLLLANQEYTFCLTSISHTGPRVSEGSKIEYIQNLKSKLWLQYLYNMYWFKK